MYFSLKRVSYPDWTLVYGGVKNSIPLKSDWIVSNDVGDEFYLSTSPYEEKKVTKFK